MMYLSHLESNENTEPLGRMFNADKDCSFWITRITSEVYTPLPAVQCLCWMSFVISLSMLSRYSWKTYHGKLKLGFLHVMYTVLTLMLLVFSISATLAPYVERYRSYDKVEGNDEKVFFFMLAFQLQSMVLS